MDYTEDDLKKEIEACAELNTRMKEELSSLLVNLDQRAAEGAFTSEDIIHMESLSIKLEKATNQLKEITKIIEEEEHNENKSGT